MVAKARTAHQHKRHGKHQNRTKGFLEVYWPYMPLLLIVMVGLVFTGYSPKRPHKGVLAYATSLSINALLAGTNQQRSGNGLSGLAINGQLNQAAQAKANDMSSRNYWSHNTPEGNPPWVFFDAAGYSYSRAGENLAYGFLTSDETITGWMNSPSHRENVLNTGYTEVGFGFADVADYQGTGPETIVVAEYGTPLAGAPAPVAAASPTPAPKAKAAPTPAPAPAPVPEPSPAPTPEPTPAPVIATTKPSTTVASASKINKEPPARKVSRLEAVTHLSLPWFATFATMTTLAGGAVVMLKHGLAWRRWIVQGERYVLHHVVFDMTIISLIGLLSLFTQTAGVIR